MFKALADKWKASASPVGKNGNAHKPQTSAPTTSPPVDSPTTDRLWTTLKRVVPDRKALADATSQLGKTQVMDVARRGLDAAQRSIVDATSHGAKYIQDKSHQGAQAVQKVAVEATTKRVQALQNATTHVASKGVQAVQQAIVGVGTKSAQVVQATTDSVKTRAKESAAYVHRHTTKKAVDAGSALVESSSAALKHTTERLHASTEHLRDPAKAARRVRNQVLLLVFSGIFVYGFASSLPSALAKYAVERQKHQQRTNDTVHAAERSKVV